MIKNEISTGVILTIIFGGAYMIISNIWGSNINTVGKMTYTNTVLIFLAVAVFAVIRGADFIKKYTGENDEESGNN